MRLASVALLLIVLMTVPALPAAAQFSNFQTTLHLRYWSAPLNFGNPAPPVASDSGSGWGLGLRFDSRNSPWSFSAEYDSLSITPSNWPWDRASFWSGNVHYRFGQDLNRYIGVFAGWAGLNENSPVVGQSGSANGPRIGAEFLMRQPSGLYLSGQASYGFSWSTNLTGFPGASNSNTADLRAAVGYEFTGGWGLEVGYRYVNWKVPTGPGCLGPGCETRFSGVTAALTFRR
jgi:hypothetical protein